MAVWPTCGVGSRLPKKIDILAARPEACPEAEHTIELPANQCWQHMVGSDRLIALSVREALARLCCPCASIYVCMLTEVDVAAEAEPAGAAQYSAGAGEAADGFRPHRPHGSLLLG